MAGLLPILWSVGVGSDIMKPIAAPIIGGMVDLRNSRPHHYPGDLFHHEATGATKRHVDSFWYARLSLGDPGRIGHWVVMVMLETETAIARGTTKLDATAVKVGGHVVAKGMEEKEMITAKTVKLGAVAATAKK